MIETILIVVGLVLLLLAALNVPSSRVSLGWLGLFFIFLATLTRALVIR